MITQADQMNEAVVAKIWQEWFTKANLVRKYLPPNFPKIVTLCGSTRFKNAFIQTNRDLTAQGIIVLSVGWFNHDHLTTAPPTEEQKVMLDELHKRKIDLSDEILVLNVDGYIGDSTRSEIEYAQANNKVIKYLNPVTE